MLAPATGFPVVSFIFPDNDPDVSCAMPATGNSNTRQQSHQLNACLRFSLASSIFFMSYFFQSFDEY
jgi:hypothetical protein